MRRRDLAALVADSRLTPDAVRVILHYAFRGEGAQEYDADELAELLEEGGPKRIAKALRRAERCGYLVRRRGGKGHTDSFTVVLTPAASDDVTDRPSDPAGLSADRSSDPAGLSDTPAAPAGLSGPSRERANQETNPLDLNSLPPALPPNPPPAGGEGGGEEINLGDDDPAQAAAVTAMLSAADRFATDLPSQADRDEFLREARGIISGDDRARWVPRKGAEPAPWTERPKLLRLALDRLRAGASRTLRGAVRYVVREQLDPNLPGGAAPQTEHARVLADPQHRNGSSPEPRQPSSGPAAAGDVARSIQEAAEVERWKAAHPDELKALREDAVRECKRGVPREGDPPAALVEVTLRRMILDRIRDGPACAGANP